MKSALIVLAFLLLSCDNDEAFDNTSPAESLKAAAAICHRAPEDMQWLQTLLEQAQTDVALQGDMYAARIDGNVIFIHQPLIMSCLACVLYDCSGERVAIETVDHEKLRVAMTDENRIYQAYR